MQSITQLSLTAYVQFLHVSRDHYIIWECLHNSFQDGHCPEEQVAVSFWSRSYDIDLDTRHSLLATARLNTQGCVAFTGLAYTLENSK